MATISWNKGNKFPERSGENSPSWKGGKIQKECLECFGPVFRHPSSFQQNKRVFCSRKCFAINNKKNPLYGSWNIGIERTEEFKEKHREIMLKLIANGKFKHPFLGISRSEETKQRISLALLRKNGRTEPKRQDERNDSFYKWWRSKILRRDDYRCLFCGEIKKGKMEADHIY